MLPHRGFKNITFCNCNTQKLIKYSSIIIINMSYSTGIELSKGRRPIPLSIALEKVYIIRSKYAKRSNMGWLTFPKCLVGKRIKVVLVNEEEKTKKRARAIEDTSPRFTAAQQRQTTTVGVRVDS